MTADTARAAYGRRAEEYTDLLGHMDATASPDRDTVRGWAAGQRGILLDVGCGPGHWTVWLDELRLSGELPEVARVEGIDPVPNFVDGARRRAPGVPFRLGVAEQLPFEDASVGGILAWYSLIHTDPDRIDVALNEFARVLGPGGELCVGFFEGPELTPFDHAVTTAYFWPVDELRRRFEAAGFEIVETHTRQGPGVRRHGDLVARRTTIAPRTSA